MLLPRSRFLRFSRKVTQFLYRKGNKNVLVLRERLTPTTSSRLLYMLYMPSRNRVIRSPFGGKRCIVDRIPLPPCCANGYCVAHLERPTGAARGGAPDEDLKMSALNMVFLQHDADGSGMILPSADPWMAASLLLGRTGLHQQSDCFVRTFNGSRRGPCCAN